VDFAFNITKKRAEFLTKLGLETPFQVLNYLPRKYADYTPTNISKDFDNERVVIKGEVIAKDRLFRIKKNLNRFSFKVAYLADEYKIVVFNRDYYYSNIIIGKPVLVAGKLDYYHREVNATDLFIKDLDKIIIRPTYSLIHGVKDYEFARVVKYSYDQLCDSNKLNEIVPSEYLAKYRLVGRKQAYYWAHFPSSLVEVKQAKRYLKYEEALVYSLTMQKLRSVSLNTVSSAKTINIGLVNDFIASLPYQLTTDQKQAVQEILADLASPKSMYRLLQGDVGSGKTIVALISMLATVSAGYQSAIMAPTDILARQHFETITKLVKPFKLKVTLLVGSLSSSERKEALTSISNGESQIIIGTHALIQESVHYQKLGLCVIDEQHRFGVEQRKMLHEKGDEVELLLMSATPIPRTLAIAIFQDLDVSSLLVPPITSKDVKTKLILGSSINTIIPNMEATLNRGEKIYVVCSLIENELSDYQNVTKIYHEMKTKFGGICPVLLLHGKFKEEEKIKVMAEFVNSPSAILVSTTVIEVGLDVKTATMMIVYDANCFGLAQLHQLRGRIGRGGQSSTCYLLDNSGDEEAEKRLNFLVNNNDGFEIARYDLALRGPGDIAGYSQSGELNFMMCDIFQDYKIFEYAKEDAKAILKASFDSKNQPILAFLAEQMAKDVAVIE